MIQILGAPLDIQAEELHNGLTDMERNIVERMAASTTLYTYPSVEQLRFELKLRSQIVAAAKAFEQSGVEFEGFSTSRCNPRYWVRTEEGGCRLKEGVQPAVAIRDIFTNGGTYGFECATAIVVIYYKAVLESIGEQNFNRLFSPLLLFDGTYDKDLGLVWKEKKQYLPGDVRYFKNPDYNPETPEWQGENAVLLEDGRYFGHGIGIKKAEGIIASLNKERKSGATRSAYLLDGAAEPDFAALSQYDQKREHGTANDRDIPEKRYIIARIGQASYLAL
ncbi:protein-glutamine gamma-glutamyltransferase [Aneurinibacillus sp. BA2021]|nr:protein-glutamine gamma-glutamyltransferase [Aneurinibacillus sp. BA2021]